MEECGFKNIKCNIILYKYADKHLQKKMYTKYKNWIKYCAIGDDKIADEDIIIKYLLHERLLKVQKDNISITDQGKMVLSTGVLLTEAQNVTYITCTFWITLFTFVLIVFTTLFKELS